MSSSFKKSEISLALFTIAVACLIFFPFFLSQDMFLDGEFYVSIARNLAEGQGSWFKLYFSEDLFSWFREHPPIGIWIHSIFYRLFGDHLFVDRLNTLLITLVTLFFMCEIWKKTFDSKVRPSLVWLPVFLFFTQHLVMWVLKNNLLEITMALFTTVTFWLIFVSFKTDEQEVENYALKILGYSFCAALATLAGVLTKGPVGLFTLSMPFIIFWLEPKHKLKWLILTYVGFFAVTTMLPLAWTYLLRPEAKDYFKFYFDSQILGRLLNSTPGGEVIGGGILRNLLNNFLLPLGIYILLFKFKRGVKLSQANLRHGFVFLTVAASGSLPILLSSSQSGFYMYPSTIFYALALAQFFVPVAEQVENSLALKNRTKILNMVSVLLILISFVAMGIIYFQPKHEFFNDLKQNFFAYETSAIKRVSVCDKLLWSDWTAHTYAQRFYKLNFIDGDTGPYWLEVKDQKPCAGRLKSNAKLLNEYVQPKRYFLYGPVIN